MPAGNILVALADMGGKCHKKTVPGKSEISHGLAAVKREVLMFFYRPLDIVNYEKNELLVLEVQTTRKI